LGTKPLTFCDGPRLVRWPPKDGRPELKVGDGLYWAELPKRAAARMKENKQPKRRSERVLKAWLGRCLTFEVRRKLQLAAICRFD
jgi:hypothetical protein